MCCIGHHDLCSIFEIAKRHNTGDNLPLHFRFWSLCVKWLSNNYMYIYIFLWEGTIGQFCTKLCDFYDTFVRLRINHEKSRCKMMSFYSHFVHKSGLNCKVYSKMWIRYYKCSWQNRKYVIGCFFSCILHKIQTIAYCSKFRIWG